MCQLVWLGATVSSDSLLWSRTSHHYCRWGITRTPQACLDLTDDGDKVIFRQFGGEFSLRTLQSGHTVIRADQFDPDGWQPPEITELCQNDDEGCATNYIIHQQETMTQHRHAVADHGRRQHRTAPNDCDHPPTAICDVLRTMRDVSELVAATSPDYCGTGSRETKLNNRTVLASTGKRPVEIERSFCPHGHGSMMMQATPQQSLYWECSTCSTTSGLSLGGCDVRLVDRSELRGCRRELGSHWGRRDTVPQKVQGQLKGVDQEACLQLIYETGQRLENQITTLGLVPRQKVESGEQVTVSFSINEGFFNCTVLDSQPTKSVSRRVRLAI